jgi:hypothetical protein
MFESASDHAARTWQGTAYLLKARSQNNANLAADWEENATQWMSHARSLEAQVANLQLALAVEKAHAEGALAMYQAMKAAHVQSPLVDDSGKRYKTSGNIKNKARLIYEATFDRILREAGIADPTKHRAD